jgi:integrase
MPLTDRRCKSLKHTEGEWHTDGQFNLYLRVRASGLKTWVVRVTHLGKIRSTTLGRYPAMSLKVARRRALEMAGEGGPGAGTTVETLVARYRTVIAREYRRPHHVETYLKRSILPRIGWRTVNSITTADCATLVSDYATASGPRAADALRSTLKSLFRFGMELGLASSNPAAVLSRRVSGYRQIDRTRTLTPAEMRLLWAAESPSARVVRFQLLTALRIGEAQGGYLEGDRWIVPAELAKSGRAHWVHVTKTARAQLPLPVCTPTNIQGWLRRWCDRQGIAPRFTPHDARRTAATLMAEAGIDAFVVERVLGHRLRGVMAVYNQAEYGEQRTEAMLVLERAVRGLVD